MWNQWNHVKYTFLSHLNIISKKAKVSNRRKLWGTSWYIYKSEYGPQECFIAQFNVTLKYVDEKPEIGWYDKWCFWWWIGQAIVIYLSIAYKD